MIVCSARVTLIRSVRNLFPCPEIHPISHYACAGCKSSSCHRLMTVPQRNPIRISETKCADCLMRERDGMVGYV